MAFKTQDELRAALLNLANRYSMDTEKRDHYRDSGAEDLAEYLHGGKEIGPVVAVTDSGDFTYLYPCATLSEAQDAAAANMSDSIYPERPVEIWNLHTGEVYVPTFSVRWDKISPLGGQTENF